MINHARTLLLNIKGSAKPAPSYPGEEYVPATFGGQILPADFNTVWGILFGVGSDRANINHRLKQYLTMIHCSELSPWIYNLDPRITYWPSHNSSLFDFSTYNVQIDQVIGSPTWSLAVNNNRSLIGTNQLFTQCQVAVASNTQITVTNLLAPFDSQTLNYTLNGSLTVPIELNNGLTLTIGTGLLPFPTWVVSSFIKPTVDLISVYTLLVTNEATPSVFAGLNDPVPMCSNIWNQNSGLIEYKLGALVLAFAYQLDSLLKNNGVQS